MTYISKEKIVADLIAKEISFDPNMTQKALLDLLESAKPVSPAETMPPKTPEQVTSEPPKAPKVESPKPDSKKVWLVISKTLCNGREYLQNEKVDPEDKNLETLLKDKLVK